MSLKYQLLFFGFFLFISTGRAQIQSYINMNPFWQGEITMTDGSKKQGWIKVPHKDDLKRVVFKKSESGQKQKIKVKDIASVYLQSPNEKNEFLFEQSPVNSTKKWNLKRKHLLLVIARNNFASFYVASQTYDVNRKKEDIVPTYRYQYGNDFPVTAYYIKKKTEESAYLIFANNTAMRFKKFAEDYFKEDPELVNDIRDKKVKLGKHLPEIISRYLKATNNM